MKTRLTKTRRTSYSSKPSFNKSKGAFFSSFNEVEKPFFNGSLSPSVNTLSNGDQQMVQRIPFSQTIKQRGSSKHEEDIFFIPAIRGGKLAGSSYDMIFSALNHVHSVAQGGTVGAGNFGETNTAVAMNNIVVVNSTVWGLSVFTVSGDVVLTTTWDARATTGPSGQLEISDENDADITAHNFAAVATDLTPSAGGRPPRSNFWARDITLRHERFHAVNQRQASFGPQLVTAAQNWLNSQTVTSAAAINAGMLQQALNEGVRAFNVLVAMASTEGDAYADGSSSYTARANAITAKGARGGY